MKLLLDTHVVLWWWTDRPKLQPKARDIIATSYVVWVSAASAWEVAIKESAGKLRLPALFSSMLADGEFSELSIECRHAEHLKRLPPHHTDPFDRMLIAQAQAERATIVTRDRQFEPYDVPVVWA